jgi:hypothetical protein
LLGNLPALQVLSFVEHKDDRIRPRGKFDGQALNERRVDCVRIGRTYRAERQHTGPRKRVENVRPEHTWLVVPVIQGEPGRGRGLGLSVRPCGGEDGLSGPSRSADQRDWSGAHATRHAVDQAWSINDSECGPRREKPGGAHRRELIRIGRDDTDVRRKSTRHGGSPNDDSDPARRESLINAGPRIGTRHPPDGVKWT